MSAQVGQAGAEPGRPTTQASSQRAQSRQGYGRTVFPKGVIVSAIMSTSRTALGSHWRT